MIEIKESENEYDTDFLDFLKRNNLDFDTCYPQKEIQFRYIRIKPNSDINLTTLENEFKTNGKIHKSGNQIKFNQVWIKEIKRIEWMPNNVDIYQIPSSVSLNASELYKKGKM